MTTHSVLNAFVLHTSGVAQNYIECEKCCAKPRMVLTHLRVMGPFNLPPYRPQSNGKIEGFHRFLKMCVGKQINHGFEWDELTPMATACYNLFPNCNARASAFFIMFGRDPINKLNMLLHLARRYFHDDNGLSNLEALKNIYQVVTQQLLNSRECYMKKHHNQQ